MEIHCHGSECTVLEKTKITIIQWRKLNCPGTKQRNFNATDKSSRICARKKNMYPFYYQRVNVNKGSGNATSLKIL